MVPTGQDFHGPRQGNADLGRFFLAEPRPKLPVSAQNSLSGKTSVRDDDFTIH
jgi:hypothetical protein